MKSIAARGLADVPAPFRSVSRPLPRVRITQPHCRTARDPRVRTQALPEIATAAAAEQLAAADGDGKLLASYAALGLAGASFVTTFFVLPQFRELLKEPVQWSEIYKALVQAGNVKALPPSDVQARVKRGAVLLDVRLQERYALAHAERSTSAPLYRPIKGWDLASSLRRLAFSLFGIFPGTELNPDFLSDVKAAVPRGKEIIVVCESGGSLENKPGVKYGFQSRSLKAVYFLQQAGYNKVSFCQGGFPQWQREGLPVGSAGDEDDGAERVGGAA